MAFTVTVDLLTGSYDAADPEDRELAEWPPQPARLHCALVAAARGDAERAALLWLERQPPPLVRAAMSARSSRRDSYVVTNELSKSGGSQTHPGRSNQLRTRTRALPASCAVRFEWLDTVDADDVVEVIDRIARRVPYLGRSTGIALIAARAGTDNGHDAVSGDGVSASGGPEWAVWEPCALTEAELSLRVAYSGYLAELDDLHDAGRSSWEANRFHGYRVRRPAVPAQGAAPRSVYPDVVMLRFAGVKPDGRLASVFTGRLRSRVLACAGPEAPAVLHGHGVPGRPHVAFLALPDVGGEHADGHLLGLAVAVPELPAEQRRSVLAAVPGLRPGGAGTVDLDVPGIGRVELGYRPGLVRPWGVNPDRWRLGSQTWVSATPMVFDRYPRSPDREEEVVRESVRMLGLPDPLDVRVSAQPLIAGAVRMRPRDLPEKMRGRLFRHVALSFRQRVAGPVLVGAGRYLGLGLFAPMPDGQR
ncbi:hypothetical protein Val02_63080 [Virgisporangium aliadipatigenens]|uniref:Type I-U CRISPR-associated protein Cas5/Cas6 n=1 Tax=Virgisporangium aliadipatigenens TaxID=741659 RepID=A0A8J4DUR3_9ACTN|nr:type I-U CRISPR-associated protein Csb2 [Virgisporangium aliadipatigenens]GIJ49422.1 hypothetical protein Val02_63080 [Virgisporangium aliadipatigenens]